MGVGNGEASGGKKFKSKGMVWSKLTGSRSTSQRLSPVTEAPQIVSFLSRDPQTQALPTPRSQDLGRELFTGTQILGLGECLPKTANGGNDLSRIVLWGHWLGSWTAFRGVSGNLSLSCLQLLLQEGRELSASMLGSQTPGFSFLPLLVPGQATCLSSCHGPLL